MKPSLVKQPTLAPTRKVAVGNLAGGGTTSAAITAFLMFGFGRYYAGDVPQDVLEILPWLVWALTWGVTCIGGWITRERHPGPTVYVSTSDEPEPRRAS